MLKAGDWIEVINPNIELPIGHDKYFEIKNISYYDDGYIGGDTTDGVQYLFAKNDYRILTPEEVKAKGLDKKSNFVPQEPNDGVKTVSQNKNRKPKQPYTKFLFVEDGSVDTDSLEKDLRKKNPEIKIVVYRQGAVMPQLVDIKESK